MGFQGGGEYLPGDERFIDALLESAVLVAAARAEVIAAGHRADRTAAVASEPHVHVVILPTAAARGRADRAGATGAAAFKRRAAATGVTARVEVALVVDGDSAGNPAVAALLAGADLIHLSGGDPDIVPGLLDGSAAGQALRAAWARGAVIGGGRGGGGVLPP